MAQLVLLLAVYSAAAADAGPGAVIFGCIFRWGTKNRSVELESSPN